MKFLTEAMANKGGSKTILWVPEFFFSIIISTGRLVLKSNLHKMLCYGSWGS